MCNRYKLTVPYSNVAETLQAWDEIEYSPRFNTAPTQSVPVVAHEGKRKLSQMKWEFIPHWASTASVRSFNARAEKIAATPSFRDAIVSQRCLIPANGFYEWKILGGVKQPFCFEVGAGELFAFAGVWDEWNGTRGCAIITTAANPLVAEIHDRMPVILDSGNYTAWLTSSDLETALDLLAPYDAGRMRRFPVSTRLNDYKNNDAAVSEPIELSFPKQGSLSFG